MTSQEPQEVFSKDTFLTSLRGAAGGDHGVTSNPHQQSKIIVEEPPAMALVREKHAQLHGVVGSLSEKISAVLGRQEKDFLAAYRAHMYNVQKELQEMREKIHRSETTENKTEKIKKIEDERDWYRKEALRLDAFTTSMTKDLKYMKDKLDAIEEDRTWLEKQLKACKKQNKLLRAELDVRVAAGTVTGCETSLLPAFEPRNTNNIDSSTSSSVTKKQGKRNSYDSSVANGGLPHLPLVDVSPMLSEDREEKLKRQIRQLKQQLQQVTQELAITKRQQRQQLFTRDETTIERVQLENFFLQCIESVKEEVARRKHMHGGGFDSRKQDKIMARSRSSGHSAVEKNYMRDVGEEMSEFTSADRVRLIERLLAHDEVLTFLYTHLFPSPAEIPTGSANAEDQSDTKSGSKNNSRVATSLSTPSLSETSTIAPMVNYSGERAMSADSSGKGSNQLSKPVGSGTAAVRAGGLPIDDSTKDYLRAMRSMAHS